MKHAITDSCYELSVITKLDSSEIIGDCAVANFGARLLSANVGLADEGLLLKVGYVDECRLELLMQRRKKRIV